MGEVKMIRRMGMIWAVALVGLFCWMGSAQAQNAVNIGGRTSVAGQFAVVSSNPDVGEDSTTLLVGGSAAYTTQNARFEFAAGLDIIGAFLDSFDAAFYVPSVQARINSNALGPEENVLLYAGAIAGLGIVRSDAIDDELGVFGPKVGVELYMSPNTAIQLQDAFLVDTDGGTTNNLTIGFKLLFQ